MIYGYARVSTDGQSVEAQVAAMTAAGAEKTFREVASGAKTDRAQLRRMLDQLHAGDVLTVTRLDCLARSTRDLLNTLAAITGKQAGFRSLGDAWADTTTAHGRLMLTVLGGLAEFERELKRLAVFDYRRGSMVGYPADRDQLHLREVVLEEVPAGNPECAAALRPMLDQFANAAGVDGSPSFDQDGKWRG